MIVAQGVTAGGVRYRVFDDSAAPQGSAEGARRVDEQRRAAWMILRAEAEWEEIGNEEDHAGRTASGT